MSNTVRPFRKKLLKVFLILAAIGILCFAALVGLVYYREVTVPTPENYDCIIVLGAQVLPTGEPSVQLRWRLNTAEEAYRAFPCPIVVTGSMANSEPRPEGEVMRDVLIADGIPQEDVTSETESINTRENIANAWAILKEKGCSRPLIVTSDYHLTRALWIAKDTGLDAQGLGSPCRSEIKFWLKNHCREALAWGKYWLTKAGMKL